MAGSMLVIAAAAAACNPSAIEPGAKVTVEGSVQDQSGTPVDGAPVALMKEPDAGDVFVGVMSIGLSCLEEEFSECGETRRATTGADGAFSYALEGRDTQGRFGNASILELTTRLARRDRELAGAVVSTRFQVQTQLVRVPLRAWQPDLRVDRQGGKVHAGWTDPATGLFPREADLGAMRRWIEFEVGRELVWRADALPGGAELDARILEDTKGGAAAWATIGDIKTSAGSGTDVEILLRSGKLPYVSTAGSPASRGRPCSVGGVDQAGCPITDGRFGEDFHPRVCPSERQDCTEPEHTSVVVDLGSRTDVRFVAVRGCDGACTLDLSDDAKSWRPLTSAAEPDVGPRDVAFAKSGAGRYVRVSSPDGVEHLREVSVWDRGPAEAAQRSMVVSPDELGSQIAPDVGGASRRLWLLLAALGGLLAVVVVVARSRRRRRAREAT